MFFTTIGVVVLVCAIGLGLPVILDFFRTGLVQRLPTAVLATGLVILAVFSMGCGLILDSVALGRRETKRLAYLALPPPPRLPDAQGGVSPVATAEP